MTTSFRDFGLAVAVALAGMGAAPTAQAQAPCGPRDIVVERLTNRYGETLTAGGLRSDTQLLEVWAAAETGTWTVLMTRADGIACVLATGTEWHQHGAGLVKMGVPG